MPTDFCFRALVLECYGLEDQVTTAYFILLGHIGNGFLSVQTRISSRGPYNKEGSQLGFYYVN